MFKRFLELDLYGRPLQLAFKDHSGSYKTYFGATLSLITYGLLIGAIYGKCDRMINYFNPTIVSFKNYFDYNDLVGKNYNDL